MLAGVVETKELLHTVIASAVAGVGLTIIFSIAIWGAARFVDLSGSERHAAAAAAAAVGIVAFTATLAVVAIGLLVMTSN